MNKNYLIIGLVVALTGVGVYLFSSGSIPTASNQLTRAKAEQMIWGKVKDQQLTMNVIYDEGYATNKKVLWPTGYSLDPFTKKETIAKLESDGLIKVKGTHPAAGGGVAIFDFTDKAQPYLLPSVSGSPDKIILLAKIKSIEVTGLTEPSDDKGVKTITANYTKYYDNITAFSILLYRVLGRDDVDLSKGLETQTAFVLYDDGWRIQ